MNNILTIAKHEHIRYWKDGKFILVSLLVAFLLYILYDSPIPYVVLALLHARSEDITQYVGAVQEIFIYDFYVILLPLLALLIAANAIAQDVNTGSIRFLLCRVRRVDYLLGKFISIAFYLFILLLVSFVGVYVIGDASILILGALLVFCISYGFVWLSMYFLMSSIFNKSMLVILLGLFIPVLMLVFVFVPGFSFISPFSQFVINLEPPTLLLNSLLLCGYTLIFIVLTYGVFEVKNL